MSTVVKKIVARNLKRSRKVSGISQAELAKMVGVSARYISKLESNPQNLTIETLESIARVLGISIPELFFEHPSPQPVVNPRLFKSLQQTVLFLEEYLERNKAK